MKLDLTFHSPSRRWKKMIAGKLVYFGYGASKDDLPSYQAALERFRSHIQPAPSPAPTIIVEACRVETIQIVYERFVRRQEARHHAGEITTQTVTQLVQLTHQFCEYIGWNKNISTAINERAIEAYRTKTYTLKLKASWLDDVSYYGFNELVSGKLKEISKGTPPVKPDKPWPLDGSGAAKPNADDAPGTDTFQPYATASFAGFAFT